MNRRTNLIFAIFDLYRIYTYVLIFIGNIKSISVLLQVQNTTGTIIFDLIQNIFILSVVCSGILYLLNKRIAYFMYFPQFVLRIIYFMPTFGIILKLANQGQNPELYKVLVIICAILEILRLIATIFVLIKSKSKKL